MNHSKLSLGEGHTSLIRLFNLEELLNWKGEIWAKCEFQNPTGSFKDRGSIAEISEAIEQKKEGVVCASTGNMAASLSAYAARAHLKCVVVVPAMTPENKLKQALIHGAELLKIDGNYDECVGAAKSLAQEKNYNLCGDYELRRIGQRSVGSEIAQSGLKLDAFVVPVGNGTLGSAIYEGLLAESSPLSFIGIQGKGADPITRAYTNRTKIIPLEEPKTIASAMKVGNPLDGDLTIQYIQGSQGTIFSVTDEEIENAQKLLAKTEGLFVEKSAAATVAALPTLQIKFYNKVVIILTGSGLKE